MSAEPAHFRDCPKVAIALLNARLPALNARLPALNFLGQANVTLGQAILTLGQAKVVLGQSRKHLGQAKVGLGQIFDKKSSRYAAVLCYYFERIINFPKSGENPTMPEEKQYGTACK